MSDRLPPQVQRLLVAPTPKAVVGIAILAALGFLLGLTYLWMARPSTRPAAPLHRAIPSVVAGVGGSTASPPRPGGSPRSPAPSSAAQVVVHVAGAVRRAGLVRLAAGARVADALRAAGGPSRSADVASVNLARAVVDGEQIVVLRRGQVAMPGAGSAGPSVGRPPSAAPGALLDLNTATVDQLLELPGVGPVLAQRILDWRQRTGRFSTVDELQEVSGIGPAKFADIRGRVRV